MKLFKKCTKKETLTSSSKDAAKERLHLVLMQDRANVSADFLDLMRQEIIEVIKKYIDIDETTMDVRLTNQTNDDGTQGAPALYANIPILNIKDETRSMTKEKQQDENTAEIKDSSNNGEQENKSEDLENILNSEENEIHTKEESNEQKNGEKNSVEEVKSADTEEKNTEEQSEKIKKIEEEKIEQAKKIVEEESHTDAEASTEKKND